ncbi:MAG: RIP metalloprotease RseP [Elusimicrobiota bacterium]|nr:RIP metalloprotease RseP [Elusimicrobiota bacterium]
MIISILGVLITFGAVIFLHELGHFLFCKLSKIKVEAFSFGFGPELKGYTKGDTRYSLRAIPLGGYVKPAGENIEELSGAPDEYFSKPWYIRLGVVLAGPLMNYILAFVLFTSVILMTGQPIASKKAIIGEVIASYPAEVAGLKADDKILAVNGRKVKTWEEMAGVIHKNVEKKISISYEREGSLGSVKLITKKDPTGKMGLIGISPHITYAPIGFVRSVKIGAHQCYYWTAFTVTTLASNIYHREKPDVAGPIGIVDIVGKAAHSGLPNFVFLIALISVAIGFFNLLPIPLLDGGHAVLYIFEGITKKKVTVKVMRVVNSLGIAFLVFILLFATYSDIKRLRNSSAQKKEAAATLEKGK